MIQSPRGAEGHLEPQELGKWKIERNTLSSDPQGKKLTMEKELTSLKEGDSEGHKS